MLLVAVGAFGQQPQMAMKGYDLYSWKVKSKWHYSLLAGTNHVKSFDEITTNKTIRVGDSALRAELENLPKGEEVFWMSDAPAGIAKPASSKAPSLRLPSRQRIDSNSAS
jgi:hypothetical protein